MSFREAVENTPGLTQAYRPGLQALRAQDRPHIRAEDPRALRGSVDIDTAYVETEPHANRWDYGICYKHENRSQDFVYWVELHTASDSEVSVVIRKAKWLRNWLRGPGAQLAALERDIVWVSSGSTSFTLTAPQRKEMAQAGLQHVGTVLRIPKKRR
jgi:hypothetical protein